MKSNGEETIKKWTFRFIHIFFGIAILLLVGISAYAAGNFHLDNVQIGREAPAPFDDGWTYSFDEGVEGHMTAISPIPQGTGEDRVLCFSANHIGVQAYIGDVLIHEYAMDNKTAFGTVFGDAWQFIHLPKEAAGQTLRLEIYSPFLTEEMPISGFVLGSTESTLVHIIKNDVGTLMFCVLTFALGIGLLCAYGLSRWKKKESNYASFLYLGLFVLFSTVWIFTDTKLLQLVMGNIAIGYLISFLSFTLLPIPFVLYIKSMTTYGQRRLDLLCVLLLIVFFFNAGLYLADILELAKTVFLVHILIIVTIVVTMQICVKEHHAYKNKDIQVVIWGLGILSVSAVISIDLFYLPDMEDHSLVFRYGLLLFILILCGGTLKRGMNLLNAEKEASAYRALAYMDHMTGLRNRASFDMTMKNMARADSHCISISVLVFDLNRLKLVNDTYGHAEGDRFIKAFADHLAAVFLPDKDVFRIGGDEFAVLLANKTEQELDLYIDRLNRRVQDSDGNFSCKIRFAWGQATRIIAGGESTVDMEELFRNADREMYRKKFAYMEAERESQRHSWQ